MLVLARKIDESIMIGDDINIKIISIEKGIVKIGIDAPRDISIIRNELLEDIEESNIAASKNQNNDSVTQLSKILKR